MGGAPGAEMLRHRRDEQSPRWRWHVDPLPARLQGARRSVDPEGDDHVAVLVCGEQERAARIDVDVARRAASGWGLSEWAELAARSVDTEGRDAVVSAVGPVHESAGRSDNYRRGGIRRGELLRQRVY